MPKEENNQDVDLENNDDTSTETEATDKGAEIIEAETATDKDGKPHKDKILVDRAEYFKLKGSKKETVTEVEKPATDKPVMQSDIHKMNERQAVRLITTVAATDSPEEQAIKTAISDNWEEVKTFYTARSGKDNVEDIVEDIKDAFTTWSRRNPQKAPEASKAALAALTRDTGARGSTSSAPTTEKKGPARIPTGMANWYPKKN